MNTEEIPLEYLSRKDDNHHARIVGRYNSSELYGIVKGTCKPKNFFKEKKFDRFGASLIIAGISAEDIWTKMLIATKASVVFQDKKEIKISDEIVIVAKPDYHFPTFLAEMKKPRVISMVIPEKWEYQLEAYYRAFRLPIQLWQVNDDITKLYKLVFTPSDERWSKVVNAVKAFDKELRELQANEKEKRAK